MSRLHIPGIVDVLRVDTASAINEIADDVRFDRRYVARGPLLNRIILRRVRRVFALDGFPLPPVAERGPVRPLPSQLHTEAKLGANINAGIKGPDIDALAAYVRGEGDKGRIGALAQQVVGCCSNRCSVPTRRAGQRPKYWAKRQAVSIRSNASFGG